VLGEEDAASRGLTPEGARKQYFVRDQKQKGLVGNTIVVPQAGSGKLQAVIPPHPMDSERYVAAQAKAEEEPTAENIAALRALPPPLCQSLTIALVGRNPEDLSKAVWLQVAPDEFRKAAEFLIKTLRGL